MIRLAVAGATGRMGRCVLDLAAHDGRFAVVSALTRPGCPTCGQSMRIGDGEIRVSDVLVTPCDVLIDFTLADGTMAWLEVCRQRGVPMVIGATGHTAAQVAEITESANVIPILKAANFSVGIAVMLRLAADLARTVAESYDVEIVETHHRHKVDAPSGTALALVDAIASARYADAETIHEREADVSNETSRERQASGKLNRDRVVFGRHGRTGERPHGQIGVHAVRMGDGISIHEVHFGGPGETITLRHEVRARETYAAGALRAAAWLIGRPPGLYSMQHLLV